jgi:hypothetical protein
MLAGQAVGRIVAEEAKPYGWESLHAEYTARLESERAAGGFE